MKGFDRKGMAARVAQDIPEGGIVYQLVDYEDRMHLLLDASDGERDCTAEAGGDEG